MEAGGQDVDEEASDELVRWQGHGLMASLSSRRGDGAPARPAATRSARIEVSGLDRPNSAISRPVPCVKRPTLDLARLVPDAVLLGPTVISLVDW